MKSSPYLRVSPDPSLKFLGFPIRLGKTREEQPLDGCADRLAERFGAARALAKWGNHHDRPKIALRTTLLLVDDDPDQLELRSLVLKMSGFTVLTASGPVEAITILQRPGNTVDIAVFDYQMPVMNGCVLAGYLRTQYPGLKIILYSAAVHIPDSELSSVDVRISKTEGMALLLEQVSAFAEVRGADHARQVWF